MKRATSVIIILMLCGCVGAEQISQESMKTPEMALQTFLDCYSQEKRSELSRISPSLDVDNVFCHKLGLEEYSDPKIDSVEHHGKFCKIGFETESMGGISINRHALLFNNSGDWEVLEINENGEGFDEFILYFDTVLSEVHSLNDLGIIKPENIVLLGELHWNREMRDFEFEFLKFLNRVYGFRDVIIEAGPRCDQYIIDEYLKTGKPELSDDFLKKVYEYNTGIPQEKRIRVWCGDIDHSNIGGTMDMVIGYINATEDKGIKDEISGIIKDLPLKNIGENRAPFLAELGNASKKIRMIMEANRDAFPENISFVTFDDIMDILRSIEDNGRCYSFGDNTEEWHAEREKTMLRYLEEAYEKSDGKILGIYGSNHVGKEKGKLGGYISEKHRVLSISMKGFKGVGGYEEYVQRPRGMMYVLDEITMDKDVLVGSKYVDEKGVDWTIIFDTLHPE